jgi:hypothetical protein
VFETERLLGVPQAPAAWASQQVGAEDQGGGCALGWGSYLAKLTFLSTVFQYISGTDLGWGSFLL